MSSVYEYVDHLVTTLVEVGVGCDKIEVKILGFPLKKKGKKKQKNKLKKTLGTLQQQALQENKAKKAQSLHRSLHPFNGNRTMVVLRLSLPYLQQTE